MGPIDTHAHYIPPGFLEAVERDGRVRLLFPDLRVVLVHGGGFYPYQAGRMERAYDLQPAPKPERSALDRLRWFHYDTVIHFPRRSAISPRW